MSDEIVQTMSDSPLDNIPIFNRVSIPAVLVQEGDDPTAALAEAGILEPIALSVLLQEDVLDPSMGILGDGITPNIQAVLESHDETPDVPR